MIGPCMCGDIQCPSCGPAQGNWQCPICRAWADDGCEHIDENGNLLAEYESEAHRRAEEEACAESAFAEELEDEKNGRSNSHPASVFDQPHDHVRRNGC